MTTRIKLVETILRYDPSNAEVVGRDRFMATQFLDLVKNYDFPCVGAKSAIAKEGVVFSIHNDMEPDACADSLLSDLQAFIRLIAEQNSILSFNTLVAIFDSKQPMDEDCFHARLWKLLKSLKQLDPKKSISMDDVSDSVSDPHFAFVIDGTPFFIVGLHPMASRYARRFAFPTLVFNLHSQFKYLRETNRFEKMQRRIRDRDVCLQGSLNPNLAEFGSLSEALQYSGKPCLNTSDCPY